MIWEITPDPALGDILCMATHKVSSVVQIWLGRAIFLHLMDWSGVIFSLFAFPTQVGVYIHCFCHKLADLVKRGMFTFLRPSLLGSISYRRSYRYPPHSTGHPIPFHGHSPFNSCRFTTKHNPMFRNMLFLCEPFCLLCEHTKQMPVDNDSMLTCRAFIRSSSWTHYELSQASSSSPSSSSSSSSLLLLLLVANSAVSCLSWPQPNHPPTPSNQNKQSCCEYDFIRDSR